MHRILFPLSVLLLAACSPQRTPVELRFDARIGESLASCGAGEMSLSDLRFYVSGVELLTPSDEWVAARIEPISPWQNAHVALVDLEDASQSCANGTRDMNSSVALTATDGPFVGVRFIVGVPFEVNHANPLTAQAPLNDSAMHWHWRSGYKFLRAGVRSGAEDAWLHLGSSGCEGTVGNIRSCSSPNRVRVEFADFDPANERIGVDVGTLIDAAAMQEAANRLDCSSGPGEAACGPAFAALGLPFGDAAGEAEQRVFVVLP